MNLSSCFECGFIGTLVPHYVIPQSRGGTKSVYLCEKCKNKVKTKGKKSQKPGYFVEKYPNIYTMIKNGGTIRKTAKACKVVPNTVLAVKADMKKLNLL